MLEDALRDRLGGLELGVLVEHAREGDGVAHLGLLLVHPGVGVVRAHLALDVGVDVLRERDVLGIFLGLVGLHLAALVKKRLAVLSQHGALHAHAVEAELDRLHEAGLHRDLLAVLAGGFPGAVAVLGVGAHDEFAASLGDVVLLVADALAALLEALRGVDEQHLIGVLGRLALAEEPHVGGDARVVERVARQLDDGVEPVIFQHVAADGVLAAAGLALVERARVLDDGHHAVVLELGEAVEHEEHLAVALGGELLHREAAAARLLELRLHGLGLGVPRVAEGRVGDAVVELESRELVRRERVAEAHVGIVLAANERARLGDAVGEGVELLAVERDAGVGVELPQAFLGAAEHLGGAHGLVVDGLGDALAVEDVGIGLDEQVGHEVDDVAAGKVRARVLVVGLGEALDEVLEDVAHVHRGDLVGRHVRLGLAEVADYLVEQRGVRVGQTLDLVGELHTGQDVLDVLGEAVDVVAEVVLDVFRVGLQGLERELGRVVEGEARGVAEEPVLDGKVLVLLVGGEDGVVGGRQAVVEALDHRHGQDDQAVLVGLVGAAQGIGHAPDERGLLLYVGADGADQIVAGGHRLGSLRTNGRPERTAGRRMNSCAYSLTRGWDKNAPRRVAAGRERRGGGGQDARMNQGPLIQAQELGVAHNRILV